MPEAGLLERPTAAVSGSVRSSTAAAGAMRAVGAAAILSVAAQLPPDRLTSAELGRTLGVSEEWILARTGIRERPRARDGERLSDYAAAAGAAALAAAGLGGEDLDLVLVATMTQDELTPNAAPIVAHALGARRAGAFDVGAACAAFLVALAQATAQIECGRARHALVIGADLVSRITDWRDPRTAPLFADGAGAAVVGPGGGGRGGIGAIVLGCDGSQASTLHATHQERLLRMDGQEVFRHAVARMAQATVEAVEGAGLALGDVDLFVFHQANARITRAVAERLGVERERIVDCIESFGNASAATLPVGLATAVADGRLFPGARVALAAFGAGFVWGGAVLEWGEVARG
ncbi:MAG TPA: beta-ketoacyl-ACP synthase 3 [Solirubrobacteraceae bacterium]|nr:beta-ketoacyl-ACP synthase 3 [Solirubrobacteraceae bacterium]